MSQLHANVSTSWLAFQSNYKPLEYVLIKSQILEELLCSNIPKPIVVIHDHVLSV